MGTGLLGDRNVDADAGDLVSVLVHGGQISDKQADRSDRRQGKGLDQRKRAFRLRMAIETIEADNVDLQSDTVRRQPKHWRDCCRLTVPRFKGRWMSLGPQTLTSSFKICRVLDTVSASCVSMRFDH